MNDNEILENMDQPEQMGDTTRLPELGLQDQPADMQPTEESVEFDLEDILREFGSGAGASAAEESSGEEAPVEEPAEVPEETAPEGPVSTDTVRLDTVHLHATSAQVKDARPVEEDITEVFDSLWEPEYEQPMGEYVPPQPIQFRPRSRIRELKRQLVNGPEKRYYELAEKGLGKMQISLFFSLLLISFSSA